MKITVENVTKTFGTFAALQNLNLSIPSGSLCALLGPSGCGKTTLLRILAGLEAPDQGRVLVQDEDQTKVRTKDRGVGFVFQHYALFRHMTVFENVAFGLRVKPTKERPSKDEIQARVHEVLGLVQLENQSHKFPDQMSGGQRQRVALARSLVVNPKILLLDEPFGALDANVRRDLRRWLRRLHDEIAVTSVLVTHDQEEALEVADQIVLMNKGRIEQIGSPEEIYLNPANPFVYEFLGSVNVFHSRLEGQGDTMMYVRPHEFVVRTSRENADDREGEVARINFAGSVVRLEIREPDGHYLDVSVDPSTYQSLGLKVGQTVFVALQNYKTFMGEGI